MKRGVLSVCIRVHSWPKALCPAIPGLHKRQRADTLAGGGENGVGHGGQSWRQSRLPKTGGRIILVEQEVHLYLGSLGKPHHSVLIIVGLDHAALIDRDL